MFKSETPSVVVAISHQFAHVGTWVSLSNMVLECPHVSVLSNGKDNTEIVVAMSM